MTLYENTYVRTFSQLEDGALEPASCNRLATKKPRQTKPLLSEQFDLDTMNLSSPQRKELASLLDEFTDIFSSGPLACFSKSTAEQGLVFQFDHGLKPG